MNDKLILILSFIILLFPLFINQFIGIANALDKTTVVTPINYINTSIIKKLIRSVFYKPNVGTNVFVLYWLMLFLSLFVNCLSWQSLLNEDYNISIYRFGFIIVLMSSLLLLLLRTESKRLNITDFFIEYHSFIIILILSLTICYQAERLQSYIFKLSSLFVICSIIFFYSVRVEKFLATKEYFKKYIFDIFRISLLFTVVSFGLKDFNEILIDYKLGLMFVIPSILTITFKAGYGRIINTKNNNINKYLERIIIITLNLFLLGGLLL
jgi:hypothetical protein